MKKILILEDNSTTVEHLKALIKEIAIKALIFAYDQAAEGYQCVMENNIDLFIVDIILDTKRPGDSSGLKFIDHIRKIEQYAFTPVIFITALEDSRLYTYEELHCYRFFEKPFDSEELKEEIRHCLKFSDVRPEKKKLYFRKDGVVVSLKQEEIVYVESHRHYAQIHLKSGEKIKMPYLTLKRFLAEADSKEFIQCSRSMVINLDYMDNIDFSNGVISLNKGREKAEIGVRFKKLLKEIFRR